MKLLDLSEEVRHWLRLHQACDELSGLKQKIHQDEGSKAQTRAEIETRCRVHLQARIA